MLTFKKILAVILLLSMPFSLAACTENDGDGVETSAAPNLTYETWMSYLSDDAPFRDVVYIGSHNSGAVDCTLFQIKTMPLDWLCCQQGTIFDQLSYGIRFLDLRITQLGGNKATPETIYCTHGTGTGIPFKDAIEDIRRFSDLYHSLVVYNFIVFVPKTYFI